jgi:hypothetical protein
VNAFTDSADFDGNQTLEIIPQKFMSADWNKLKFKWIPMVNALQIAIVLVDGQSDPVIRWNVLGNSVGKHDSCFPDSAKNASGNQKINSALAGIPRRRWLRQY